MSKSLGAVWSKVGKLKESIIQSFKNAVCPLPLMDLKIMKSISRAFKTIKIPNHFADESFRLIDDDNNESYSEENNIQSDNDEFDFIMMKK